MILGDWQSYPWQSRTNLTREGAIWPSLSPCTVINPILLTYLLTRAFLRHKMVTESVGDGRYVAVNISMSITGTAWWFISLCKVERNACVYMYLGPERRTNNYRSFPFWSIIYQQGIALVKSFMLRRDRRFCQNRRTPFTRLLLAVYSILHLGLTTT